MAEGRKTLIVILTLIITGVLLSSVCYLWLDKSLALWIHTNHISEHYSWIRFFTYIKTPIVMLILLLYISYVFRACFYGRLTKIDKDSLFIANSVFFAYMIQNKLHLVFGRYWPNSWIDSNPALLTTGDYGFHFFREGSAFESFPSGHTTVVVSLCAAIWVLYPKLRFFSVFGICAIIIGLVGMNYHFLGDCIAGFFIAITMVYILAYLRTLPQ